MNINKKIAYPIILSIFFNQTSSALALTTEEKNIEINNEDLQLNNIYSNKTRTNDNSNTNTYPDNILSVLSQCNTLIEVYTNLNEVESLYEAISLFSSIPLYLEGDLSFKFEDGDIFDYTFYSIRDIIYNLSNEGDLKHNTIIYFAEALLNGWTENKKITLFKDKYLISEIIDYNNNKITSAQPYLENIKYLANNPDKIEEDTSSEDVDEDFESTIIPPPNFDDDNNSNDTNNNQNNNQNNSQHGYFEEFIKKNNKCVKVTTYYRKGVPVSSRESSIPKSDYIKCGIYDYVHYSPIKNNTVIDKDYLYNDQNPLSEYTIYYTLDKTKKEPYYFNTGIYTSASDNSATYNQVKDALYQLSIKAEGFSITDTDKALTILEGKPIVLKKSKDHYSKTEIERLLNSFTNVGLKVLKTSEKDSYSLENYLTNNKIDSIIFNDNEIKLSSEFILKDEELFGPVQEIVSHLGGKTSLNKDTLTISKDDIKITIDTNSSSYILNNEKKNFRHKPIIHNSSIYCEINTIISELGYDLVWDYEAGELYVNNK